MSEWAKHKIKSEHFVIFSLPYSLLRSMCIYCIIIFLKGSDNIKGSEHTDNTVSSETLICLMSALSRNFRTSKLKRSLCSFNPEKNAA